MLCHYILCQLLSLFVRRFRTVQILSKKHSRGCRAIRKRRLLSFISALIPVHSTEEEDDRHRRWWSRNLISDFYTRRCYCYCSYTRAVSCCWDKMCFVCLSYLLGTIRAGDDDADKRDAGTRRVLRSDTRAHDGCRSRRERCDGRLGKALRSCFEGEIGVERGQ